MNSAEMFDKSLSVDPRLHENDIVWHDVREQVFDIYGLYQPRDGQPFKRIPQKLAEEVSEIMELLYAHTAGGRVRFTTNSRYVAVKCFSSAWHDPDSMYADPKAAAKNKLGRDIYNSPAGRRSVMDLYIDAPDGSSTYGGTFFSPIDFDDSYESIVYLPEGKKHITINLPTYNIVNKLYVGIADGSSLEQGLKYKYTTPVVYYGSSITQGASACRPGNTYQAIISRMLNCDYINLGFSDSARGEQCMADYIADMDMSVLFMDYDHNAPDAQHLEKTHERMYLTIRKKHPDLPIIITSMVSTEHSPTYHLRREAIYKTYINAMSRGENVYFIDGQPIFGEELRDCCTVDGLHPNDYGFVLMTKSFEPYIRMALQGIKPVK